MIEINFEISMTAEQASRVPQLPSELGPTRDGVRFTTLVALGNLDVVKSNFELVNEIMSTGASVEVSDSQLARAEIELEELSGMLSVLRQQRV